MKTWEWVMVAAIIVVILLDMLFVLHLAHEMTGAQ